MTRSGVVSPLQHSDAVELQDLTPNDQDMPLVRIRSQDDVLQDISSDKPQGEAPLAPKWWC